MDPENGSENAPNYEDVQSIDVIDDHTIAFHLDAPNVAFLDYMTMAVLPEHLLAGEDMQESDFFRHPIGTGPYTRLYLRSFRMIMQRQCRCSPVNWIWHC